MSLNNINKRGEYVNFGIQWLLDHHLAKEQQRREMANDLGIQEGDKILDLGSWMWPWAMEYFISWKSFCSGSYHECWCWSDFIDYAKSNLEEKYKDIINFKVGDFSSVRSKSSTLFIRTKFSTMDYIFWCSIQSIYSWFWWFLFLHVRSSSYWREKIKISEHV